MTTFSFNALLLAEQSTGMRTLMEGLLAGLSTMARPESWIVYTRPGIPARLGLPRWDGCQYVELAFARSLPGRLMTEMLLLPALDRRHHVAVSYSPVSYLPLNQKLPSVVTFVDFAGQRVPSGYRWWQRLSHGLRYEHALFHASAIATISETMSRDLKATYGERLKSRIVPILCGVGPEFFQLSPGLEESSGRGSPSPRGLLLASGGTNPRKDVETLARAFAMLPAAVAEEMDVRVVGPTDTGRASSILALLPEDRRSRFRFMGFVSRSDVLSATSMARILVFPTLDEGFGLPVLEAMAAGKPVICSNLDVLREVGGDCADYFPVRDARALSESILRLWADEPRRRRMGAEGQKRARRFTWESVAGRLLDLLRSAQGQKAEVR